MTTMMCRRCGNAYIYCKCIEPGEAVRTARVLWRAACATQRRQLDAGITAPRLTCGVIRPEGIEKYIDSGRITRDGDARGLAKRWRK